MRQGREALVVQGLPRGVSEEAFDHVQPAARGGREVRDDPRDAVPALVEPVELPGPFRDRSVLVRGVVVLHHVQRQPLRAHPVDAAQEHGPLPVRVRGAGLAGGLPGGVVERGEEAGDAVADVVVHEGFGPAGLQRQGGLRALESLALGLLVAAEHDAVLGRAHVTTRARPRISPRTAGRRRA